LLRQTDIVVTTIWEPAWLQGYLDNLRRHGRDESVTLRIITDRKTPASVYAAADAARAQGFGIDCPSLDEQVEYLRKRGVAEDFIPWNTDNRRNVGFLRAWDEGADVLISIDDDNYCDAGSDFVGAHHCVGMAASSAGDVTVADGAPWFNICTRLQSSARDPIFPRGFPYAARDRSAQATPRQIDDAFASRLVALNAGLWLDDPDVDAITRLAQRPSVRAATTGDVILGHATWSPINTQNTALMRAAMPAYYYVRMGFALQGMKIDRFGDILSGYFAQKCAKHLGHVVRFGSPVSRHRRTPHNLLVDLYHELAGIALVEELLPWLQELQLEGGDYAEAYRSLSDALGAAAGRFRGFVWEQGGREFLRETAACMKTWLGLLR
jgi:hypothetical protein